MNDKFVTLFLNNKVDEEEIDTFIEQWAEVETDESLADFLGMTPHQYAEWCFNPNQSLKEVLAKPYFRVV